MTFSLNIKGKLVVGFSLIVLMTIGVGVFAVTHLKGLALEIDNSDRILDDYGQRTETLYHAMEWGYPVFREAEALVLYLQTDEPEEQQVLFKRFGEAGQEFQRINDAIKGYASTPREREFIARIEQMQKSLQTDAIMLIAVRDGEGEYGAETKAALKDFQDAVAAFVLVIEELVAFENTSMKVMQTRSKKTSQAAKDAAVSATKVMTVVCILAVIVALVISVVLSRMIVAPMKKMRSMVGHISSGDLTHRSDVLGTDEMAEMSKSLNEMADGLGESVSLISTASADMGRVSEETLLAADLLREGAEIQVAAIDTASSAIEEMGSSVKETAANTDEAKTRTREATASISEISTSIGQVAVVAEELFGTVDEVSSSIAEMASSIKEIAAHASQLSDSAEETSASVLEIDASAKEVGSVIIEAAAIAEATASDAAAGGEAVRDTIKGMRDIEEAVVGAAEVVRRLGGQSKAVGNLVTVIDDVTDLTGLLALNATIMAAQAGEHGRGFGVVAGQMRDLAERTKASTEEIEKLINGVQGDLSVAMDKMEIGAERVKSGVELSNKAGDALEKILSGANASMEMVSGIATASREQVKASKQASAAMEKITEMLGKVYRAIEEQERGSGYIDKAAEKMMTSATQVKESTQLQHREGKVISEAIGVISNMVISIDTATQEQAKGIGEIVKSVEEIKTITTRNVSSVGRLKDVTGALVSHSDMLEKVVKKFKID